MQNSAGPILLTLLASFFLTLLFVPLIKVIAQKYKFVSKIDFRRRELVPRPLMGGIAVFAAALAANAVFNAIPLSFVLPGLILCFLGAADDKLQIHPRLKFACNIGAVCLWLALTPASDLLLVKAGLPVWMAWAFHAFWVVGLINAFNMIDGMDGLASGMAMLGFAFLGAFLPGELSIFAWSMAAGCAGHLVFNMPPASIFLGDSGSLLLGFLLASMGSIANPGHAGGWGVLIPMFILAHPEIDAILAMYRRHKQKTPLFHGDKDHIHHKLRRIGLGPKQALFVAHFTTFYCGCAAILISQLGTSTSILLTVFLAIAGASAILMGVYFAEHRLGVQYSRLGTPILHQNINITPRPVNTDAARVAIVFDLLPYYQELQQRDIPELRAFINDFGAWINNTFKGASIIPAGPYSIIVLSNDEVDDERVVQSFKAIASEHQVLKNGTGVPWGLHFHRDLRGMQVSERKYGTYLRTESEKVEKAA